MLASCFKHSSVMALTVACILAESYAFLSPAPAIHSSMRGRFSTIRTTNVIMQEDDSHVQGRLWIPSLERRDALKISFGSVLAAGGTAYPFAAGASQGRDLPSNSVANPVGSVVTLKNGGGQFPLVSFGLQIYDNDQARKLTHIALEAGYRNFFASVLAGNQKGFAQAVKESGIPREQLYICGSVVSNRAVGFDKAYKATTKGWQDNMKEFGTGGIQYLDQIMLDYPGKDSPSILGQWKAFQDMHAQGLTKSLSVSNFSPEQIDFILDDDDTVVKPCVNQLPLNLASRFNAKIKSTCEDVGKKYGKSAAQVALRWIIECGAAVTTQSTKKEHFVEDLNIFDFKFEPEDFGKLDTLVGRVGVQ